MLKSQTKAFKINLILCAILHGINHYLLIFFKSLYPEIAAYFQLTNVSALTTRLTIAYTGYGISNFFTGILGRYFNLKFILFAGMCLMSLAVLSIAFIPPKDYFLVVLACFLMGLGGGVYHPAANTLITSQNEQKPGRSIGMLSIGSAFGFILAPVIGTYLGKGYLGFRLLFFISGLVSLLISFLFLILVKENIKPKKPQRLIQINWQIKNKRVDLALLIFLLLLPALFKEIMNWSYYEITPYWVLAGFSAGIGIEVVQMMAYLPGLIFQPLTGFFCDRFGAKKLAILTILLACLGFILFIFPSLLTIGFGLFLFGTGMSSSTVANETFMATLGNPRQRLIIYAVVLSVALGFGGYLAGLAGVVVDYFGKENILGYQFWFGIMALILALSLITYAFINKRN